MVVTKAGSDEVKQENSITPNRKSYRCCKEDEKEGLFFQVYEKGLSVRAAALQLQIKPHTVQYWVQQDQNEPKDQIVKNVGGGRPPGRPPKLVEEHPQFLIDLIDKKPSLVLDEIMASLTEQFSDLKIKKSALHDSMTKQCKISLAHFQLAERNNPEKIEDRHAWVTKWLQTDMDFCVKTRAMTTTILGAISPFGVVNVSVRRPKAMAPSKKRKSAGSSRTVDKTTSKRGTVTGHYFNCLSGTMDVLDRHEMFKDNYLVIDNAPISQHEDIRKHIENRGYRCIYLPPYSPELNPTEQFWSISSEQLSFASAKAWARRWLRQTQYSLWFFGMFQIRLEVDFCALLCLNVIANVWTDRLAILSMHQWTSTAFLRIRFLVDVDNDILRLTLLSLACFVSVPGLYPLISDRE
ncbi:hypothetical protein [Parasitella parasitica]|uniref:Tc1-like transposase DDE domain-containing protein n=1 Tax=Parasitella parasitica TaxID=35722 RepID=A0A0B7NGA1_9FUNG|nr:hypothetical protein [Parasitella parasitica]